MIPKKRKRYKGIADLEEQSIALWHLIQKEFPGINFEHKIEPATEESEEIVIDHRGKIRLDQNDGTPVPLDQIPDTLTGKDADSVDGYHGSDLIRPVNITFIACGSLVTWNNQPAVLHEFLSQEMLPAIIRYRLKFDLTKFTKTRLIVNVEVAGALGFPGAQIRVQYSTDQSTWYYLDGISEPSVVISSVGLQISNWIDLVDGAKADVFLRLVGLDGDGAIDPGFGSIVVQFK